MREWKPLAEQGDAKAQARIGFMYSNGQGVPQDYVVAHLWSSLAVAQGKKIVAKNRDIFAEGMNPANIPLAERPGRECPARDYKNCGQ